MFELLAIGVGGCVFWFLSAETLGGMGREVGGEVVITAYTFSCLYLWPVLAYLYCARPGSNSPAALRRIAIGSAPLLYASFAFWAPNALLESLALRDVWFNYFGEVLILTQFAKSVLLSLGSWSLLALLGMRRRAAVRACAP